MMFHAGLTRRHWLLALFFAASAHGAALIAINEDSPEVIQPAGTGNGVRISLATGSRGLEPRAPETALRREKMESSQQSHLDKPKHHQSQPHQLKHKNTKSLAAKSKPLPEPESALKPDPDPVEIPVLPKEIVPQQLTASAVVTEEVMPQQLAASDVVAEDAVPQQMNVSDVIRENTASAGGDEGNNSASDTAVGSGEIMGNSGDARANYAGELEFWLEKYKEYPRLARMRRTEGVAELYFRVDRQGKVLAFRLQRSSGDKLLDRAVLDMLQRAQPLPAIPVTISGADLAITIPVEFSLW